MEYSPFEFDYSVRSSNTNGRVSFQYCRKIKPFLAMGSLKNIFLIPQFIL